MNGRSAGGIRRMLGRKIGVTAAAVVVAAVSAPIGSVPAGAQVGSQSYGGYATGTVVHTHALQNGATRVEDAEIAFSGASVDSTGLTKAIQNEFDRVVQPVQNGKNSYGRGAGLEIGLAQPANSEVAQIQQAGRAEAAAAPTTQLITKEIAAPTVAPVLYAKLLRGQAQARWDPTNCITGADLGFGLGYADHTQLVETGANAGTPEFDAPVLATEGTNPPRTVSQSVSRNKLTVQSTKPEAGKELNVVGSNWALMSETRQTIAPVTLLKGTPQQITIEVLGEWVLQAVAGGIPGTAFLHYGPGSVSPETPILRTINSSGVVSNVLTFQQVTGPNGFTLPANPLINITVGEQPRQIGSDDPATKPAVVAADGTSAAGAVDVVRVQVLEQKDAAGNVTVEAADIRVGHMEATARVPAGGVVCPGIRVTKDVDKKLVVPNETFTYTVAVTNLTTCVLTNAKVDDVMSVTDGVKYSIVSVTPADKAPRPPNGLVVELGELKPGETKSFSVTIQVASDSTAGVFTNKATATAVCGIGSAQGSAQVNVPLRAEVTINVPQVRVEEPRELPATGGGAIGGGLGILALAGAAALRRLRRAT